MELHCTDNYNYQGERMYRTAGLCVHMMQIPKVVISTRDKGVFLAYE